MALEAAVTDLDQLKSHPEVACLVAANAAAVEGAKFDRNELSIYVERTFLRGACTALKNDAAMQYDTLSDLTLLPRCGREPISLSAKYSTCLASVSMSIPT